MTVDKLLAAKGSYVPTIAPRARIMDVVEALEAENVGALVVSYDGLVVQGMISERDVVRGIQRFGSSILTHTVRYQMAYDVVTCRRQDSLTETLVLMNDRNVGQLPVVEDGKMVGIVSFRDVMGRLFSEPELGVAKMREYISHGN